MAAQGLEGHHRKSMDREIASASKSSPDEELSTESVPSLAAESKYTLAIDSQIQDATLPLHHGNDHQNSTDNRLAEANTPQSSNAIPRSADSTSSLAESNRSLSHAWDGSNDTFTPDDYFASKNLHGPHITDYAQRPSSNTSTPRSSSALASKESSAPASPDSRFGGAWKDLSTQSNVNSTFHPSTIRPTSVPNFQSQNLSRRREGPDYPNYPNQSFRALQDQYHPPPYKPGSSHSSRTRSSHPSQSLSSSSNDFQPMSDTPQLPSGAKTVGNTPAQSPGLFSPAPQPRKRRAGDSDDGRSGTPMLHPTHQKPPKE